MLPDTIRLQVGRDMRVVVYNGQKMDEDGRQLQGG
jgi:hypothetical protein